MNSAVTTIAKPSHIQNNVSAGGSSGPLKEPSTLEMSPNASMKSKPPTSSTCPKITTVTAQEKRRRSFAAARHSAQKRPSLATELVTNGNSALPKAPWTR